MTEYAWKNEPTGTFHAYPLVLGHVEQDAVCGGYRRQGKAGTCYLDDGSAYRIYGFRAYEPPNGIPGMCLICVAVVKRNREVCRVRP